MAIFENIGKKVTEAAQVAAKKSGELVEVTKLNMNISSEEDRIQKLYEQIGREIYKYFTSEKDIPEELKDVCAEIRSREETIKGIKARILEIKNLQECNACGAELERNIAFCPKCGAKQEH
ncbi:MAG TPA: zinc ribbon domain-containing protein [Clostridiales bacterium]|nr:zinc ribbon domain-containing protein [Clostridiales bacterium]